MAKKPTKKKAAKKTGTKKPPAGNPMRDLHKLLEKQDFSSVEEIEAFMQKISEGPIPEFEPESVEEVAEDLVFDAMELEGEAQMELIGEALDLDPNCILAYYVLGAAAHRPAIAIAFYQRGLALGVQRFMTEEYLEQSKGHFWGLHETRPFMECLQGVADCEFFLGNFPEAMGTWDLMLELNPNDNQGVRYDLMLCLAGLREHDEYERLYKEYSEDGAAAAAFNHALHLFTKHGPGPEALKALQAARTRNEHVVPMLLKNDPPPFNVSGYMLGSEEEAAEYLDKGHLVWNNVPGATDWLRQATGKAKK